MQLLTLVAFLSASLCAQEVVQYDALKLKARAVLNAGQPAAALELAAPLLKKAPDDYDLQYTVAKAHRLLGHLVEAEKATQWLLDLRPEFLGGLHEAALLRECFNDLPGALDLLNSVFRATPVSKYNERAELLSDIARIFDKQDLKQDSAQLRKEIIRLKGLESSNAKATATSTHQ